MTKFLQEFCKMISPNLNAGTYSPCLVCNLIKKEVSVMTFVGYQTRWLWEKPLNKQASSQKLLLVLILDTSLTFDERMEAVTSLVNRTISLVKKIITYHLSSLTKTYKSFLRSQLDFGDVIFGEAYNISFHQRLLYLQNKTLLTITDAMNGSSIQKLYRELGLGFQKKTMVSKLRFLQECWKTVPK